MKKIIKLLVFVILLLVSFSVNAEEYDEYKSGDLVKYNNIAFYVMFDSDKTKDSVQLIKMTPLTHDEINKYTDNKAYMDYYSGEFKYFPSSNQIYGNMAYYYSDTCYDYSNYDCKNDYESSNVKKVVDLWTEENINSEDIIPFEDGYLSRLIGNSDFEKLGLSINSGQGYNELELPKWLTMSNYYGWTMEAKQIKIGNSFYNSKVIVINPSFFWGKIEGYLTSMYVFQQGSVKPTIILKKNRISKIISNEYHKNEKREYKAGDIINYNDTQFYVIKNSSVDDDVVTVLKNKPLTEYELNKYGSGYINNYINQNTFDFSNTTPGEVINYDGMAFIAYISNENCRVSYSPTYSVNLSGCNPNYDVSNVKHIVDQWFIDTVDSSDIVVEDGYYARLINEDDLVDLGYINRRANTVNSEAFRLGDDTPKFMMDDNTKGMLTMVIGYTYHGNSYTSYGIAVSVDGYSFLAREIPNYALGTVRPVLNLNKKEFEKKITNVEEQEDDIDYNQVGNNNVIVDVVSDVDNSDVEDEIINSRKDSISVSVPNTLSRRSIILIIIGIVLIVVPSIIYYKIKK